MARSRGSSSPCWTSSSRCFPSSPLSEGTCMARFEGRVVLISGAARGQGAAEARLLVAEGGKVVIGDVLEAEGEALARELGPSAVFFRQDVTLPVGLGPCGCCGGGDGRPARLGEQRRDLHPKAADGDRRCA